MSWLRPHRPLRRLGRQGLLPVAYHGYGQQGPPAPGHGQHRCPVVADEDPMARQGRLDCQHPQDDGPAPHRPGHDLPGQCLPARHVHSRQCHGLPHLLCHPDGRQYGPVCHRVRQQPRLRHAGRHEHDGPERRIPDFLYFPRAHSFRLNDILFICSLLKSIYPNFY